MRREFTRFISFLLAMVLVLGLCPQVPLAVSAEEGSGSLTGKKLSILGASISTYTGISNNTDYNSTIGSNAVYYTAGRYGVYAEDTWWMQVANDLGLELLVNNSWSGSSALHTRSGTVGAYVDRCVQLHNNDGEEPDIIGIQMGTNDYQYYKDTLGTADIDYDALIAANEDGTYAYAEPVTSLEAIAIILHKISVRYPGAEVYYLGLSTRVDFADGEQALLVQFNADLKTVCDHFGAGYVDIYNSGITQENFTTYIGDGRVHPNTLGMDCYTEAFKAALLANTAYSVDTKTVSFDLTNATADYGHDKTVVTGDSFSCALTPAEGMELEVSVTMGGEDITETAYANGTVTIDAVTADVTITAKGVAHVPQNYRWEFDGTDLAAVEGGNALTKNAGTTTDGVFSTTRYALDKTVVLLHDHPWAVEWKCEGTWRNTSGSGGRMFTSTDVNADYNARYIFKSANSYLIAMGEKTTSGSHNYGIALSDYGIDGSELHTYRLENRVTDEGNMVYLFVDGAEIGPMTGYYIGTTSQNSTSDWLSGKDFSFPYIGTDTHGLTNCSIEYIQVWEAGSEDGHYHYYEAVVTEPTYTAGGYTTYICSCGDSFVDNRTDALHIYRWEMGEDVFQTAAEDGITENTLTLEQGSVSDGTFSDAVYSMDTTVRLSHKEPWAIQWKSEGDGSQSGATGRGSVILTSQLEMASSDGTWFIYKQPTSGMLAICYRIGSTSKQSGILLTDYGIDPAAEHTYRLENRVAEDGSNMVYLSVDGVELGAMNNYFISASSQNTTTDILVGQDLTFRYMGASWSGKSYYLNNCSIDYIQVWEGGCDHSYESTVTAPTCTEKGYTTHTCTACGDSFVDSYVDALGHSWENGTCAVCGTDKMPYQRLTYFTVDVEADGTTYTDNAVLYLPANYSPDGEPVKLVIYCKQGASQITSSSNPIEDVGFYNYLISLGYAVLGVDGVPDAWRDELGLGERAVGNPMAVQGTEKAYDYVIENYNIAADGCFISGYSQGGHYAQNVIDLTDIPILAAAEQSPVCSMRYHQWDLSASVTVGGVSYSKAARLNVARIYGFPAVTTNAELLALEYDADLVAAYDPWVRNSENVYTGFVQSGNLWYLPEGTSLDDITMTKTVKCPVKIWCAEDDTAISADVMQVFVKAIQNAGGTAEISVASSGGHGFFQKQTAVGTFTENGKTYNTLPIAVEIAQWFERYGGYGCKHNYSGGSCTICGTAGWDADGDGVLEILAIGNSFSADALEYAYQIAEDLGIEEIVIGNLYIGGCTLETHAANAAGDLAKYTYYYNDSGTWTSTKNYKLSTALSDRSWDYVSMQQASGSSGVESTYNDDLTDLIAYVQDRSDAKLVWHMTWAYQQDSTHSAFPTYNKDQMTMYNSIVSAVRNKVATNGAVDLIVPSGTAVQNARTSLVGDTLTRDGYHMSYDYGRYLTGLMFIKTLTGLDVDNITYAPSGVDAQEMAIAIESVNNASEKPFAVTQSAYVEKEPEIPEEGYILLRTELYKGAFWHPLMEGRYDELIADYSNSHQYFATIRFTREALPVGSIIVLADGWQYRPDGWITDTLQTGTREAVTTASYVVITEEWWNDYTIRSFNISKVGLPSLENVTEEEVRAAFQIYVPEESHIHVYSGITCSICGAEHPEAADYSGKVISILGGSTCTFAGYIPVADGFNLEHRARYPQDNLLTDVNDTWWMQVINELDAKLGINDSWAGSTVSNFIDGNSGDLGEDAAMASLTRIQNLGANGTPDVILFYGAMNDIGKAVTLGTFDPDTAPAEADLTATKWDSLADAYVAAILRMQYYYPEAEIISMLPGPTASYYTEAERQEYCAVIAAICAHYGVECVDLSTCGLTTDDLPDGTHPDAEGMDYITAAVLDTLLADSEMEAGENVVYSITHELTNAAAGKSYYKGVSAGKSFVETVSGEDVTVTVTMGGQDITASAYADGVITIESVTGDIVITATGAFNADGHLQQLPEAFCAGTNLWPLLEPENIYYTATGWGNNSNSNYSVTVPVEPGDRIWATSFGKAGENGYSMDGVRMTWFDENGVLESLSRDVVYAEFAEYGCITVPQGAVAVNIPMVSNADTWELYILTQPHTYSGTACTLCGAAHPEAADYSGKVISILGDSISTFAGYIPAADGFNLEHYARYPQDNLLTDVNETWWMQVLTELDAKLGINESWRSTEVYNYIDEEVNSSYDGTKACMASLTRIQNLGSNGTPDVILFYGGTNDITQRRTVGSFDPATAPTEVDLTSAKWDTVADAYVAAIMRMQYYYPDAQIIAMLPTFTYKNTDAVIEEYNSVFAAICEHYGVTCVDLRDCGITTADLPDGTHPDAEGMDYITDAVLEILLTQDMEPGESVVYSVTQELDGAEASLGYYKGVSAGKSFVETISGENVTVTVTMNGVDITASVYADGVVSIPAVTGNLVITAEGKETSVYAGHLQQLPEDICAGTNLWTALEPENVYYTGSDWGINATGLAHSVTIPITPGDQLWATSFQGSGTNGGTGNGIRITWFDESDVLRSMSPSETYAEFSANGYLTAPEGAVAVNVVMWNGDESNEFYILTQPHTPGEAVVENEGDHGSYDLVTYCTICGGELSREHDDGYLPGDINGDGSVNNKDLTRLFQYLSGYDVEVVADALDVNGDGSVNNKDVTRLFQYLSSWDVEIH